ncbi:Hypothetical predicted protein, partial [Xyrichtys novacula]
VRVKKGRERRGVVDTEQDEGGAAEEKNKREETESVSWGMWDEKLRETGERVECGTMSGRGELWEGDRGDLGKKMSDTKVGRGGEGGSKQMEKQRGGGGINKRRQIRQKMEKLEKERLKEMTTNLPDSHTP